MSKWAILLYGLGISGGANVIFNHALYAVEQGDSVTIITRTEKSCEEASWHEGTEKFKYKALDEICNEEYDVAIATEWRSAYDLMKVKSKRYVYFVQSVESRFFSNDECLLGYLADNTYNLPYDYITEASWIKAYLKDYYGKDARIVLNGIDKKLFSVEGDCIEKRNPCSVRFLIEGSVNNWLKNVENTVKLCLDAGVQDIWLVTPDDIDSYPGVSRVFSQIDYKDMPAIYRSCDVLIKLSLVEGMFGPPLEMFHCGGTAITYNIEGSEEYLVDGFNSIVVEKNNENEVKLAINKLNADNDLLNNLKSNAQLTANKWDDWKTSSRQFYDYINETDNMSDLCRGVTLKNAMSGANAYRRVEKYLGACPSNIRIEKLVDEYNKNPREVFIFGAGDFCKNTIILLSEYDIPIKGIVVTSKNNNPSTVLGHRVYEVNEIGQHDMIIYISTERNIVEIKKELESRGYLNII